MRRYSVTVNNSSVTTAKDLLRITAPASMVLCVMRAWIDQQADVTNEQNAVVIQRSSNALSATAVTPEKLEVGDPSASFTCQAITADHTLTGSPIIDEGFNWVSGYLWIPAPEERIWVPPSANLVFRLNATPAAAKGVTAGLIVMEVG